MTATSIRSLVFAGGVLFVLGGLTVVPVLLGWTELQGSNEAGFVVLSIGALAGGVLLIGASRASTSTLTWVFPYAVTVGFVVAILTTSASVVFVGPTFGGASIFFPQIALLAFTALRRGWAVTVTALAMVGFAVAQVLLDNPVAPVQHFVNVIAGAVAVGVLLGGLTNRLDTTQLALSDVNRRLRRFLAPQVADAIVADRDSLEPHRRAIAALFVDLRGFTAFTNAAKPARVMEVLTEYYAAVEKVVDRYAGTIGGFDGDGVFAFVGDPVPNTDAASDSVSMARDIATALDPLVVEWSQELTPLGYGIGVSFGEATIGLVGSEGRLDYTPVGAVVNMAARLCGVAQHGEIVIDDELRRAAQLGTATARAPVDLKGFGVTPTYAVAH